MYNKVLVATDGSENAMRAVQKVVEFAKDGSVGEIVAFLSIKHQLIPEGTPQLYMVSPEDYDHIMEDVETAAEALLDETKAILDEAGVPVAVRLVTDKSPEEYAIGAVDEEGFDLVVLGCKGHHSKLKEIFLGTVPTRVLHAAKCDVLVVR
ncbi:MAG TPA: universal stress protein [Candidatus Lokiarchaeia archaeon]|nr:universal stress protein [Candidatus Lokiarchaeia archaeon]